MVDMTSNGIDLYLVGELAAAADTYNQTQTDYYYGKFQGILKGIEILDNEVSYEFDGTYIKSVTVNGVTVSVKH